MTLTLDERKKLLRAAATGADTDDFAPFAEALAGATEEERVTLAKTLAPAKLHKAEGTTPRSAYVLVSLGKPNPVDTALFPFIMPDEEESQRTQLLAAEDAIVAGMIERDAAWLGAFLDRMGAWHARDIQWRLGRRAILTTGFAPTSAVYASDLVLNCTRTQDDDFVRGDASPAQIIAALRTDPLLLERDFWLIFTAEGAGAEDRLIDGYADEWNEVIRSLCETEPGFRDRILTESLRGMLRDFSARNITWYHRIHRLLEPSDDEIIARQADYCAVLQSEPSVAVGLAQEMLERVLPDPRFEISGLIEASDLVLGRTEKKLLKAQLALLAKLVDARSDAAALVAETVAECTPALPPELQRGAAKLVAAGGATGAVVTADQTTADPTGTDEPGAEAVLVAAPRTAPLEAAADTRPPFASDEEAFDAIAAFLEGEGDGADLPRIIAHLYGGERAERRIVESFLGRRQAAPTPTTTQIPPELGARAAAIVDEVWDPMHASPRCNLAALLCDIAELDYLASPYRGYHKHVYASAGEEVPEEWDAFLMPLETLLNEDGERVLDHDGARSGFRNVATEAPTALCVAQFTEPEPPVTPLPAIARRWTRYLAAPAKEQRHRAQAAEAIARLAESGLLDPELLAQEVTAMLASGYIMAGRVAETLTDTAAISAIAGFRVLQTLSAVMPGLILPSGKIATQGGRLVELAARRSGEYGTPIPVPDTLARKRKGTSALALAIRVLEDARPRPTELAREAAAQAQRSRA